MTNTVLDKDTIQVTIGDDHAFNCTAVTIGRTGENSISQLEITIPPELNAFWAYLDFKKPRGGTVKTGKLDIVKNKLEYNIPNGLLDENGNLEVQLVLQGANGEIWKSATKKFVVLKSIDASDDVPVPELEDFISDAIAELRRLEEVSEGTLEYVDEVYTKKTKTNSLEKRITNLEQGIIPSPFVTDETTAYQKSVPTNALPFAEVEKIGGMTRKCTNLFDKSKTWNVERTETGFKFTNTRESGAPVTLGYLKDIAPNIKVGDSVTFYADCVNEYYGGQLHIQGSAVDWHKGTFHTVTQSDLDNYVFAYGLQNVVCEFSNVIITKIENAPYEPYFEGLRSAPVTEVESVGANRFEPSNQFDAVAGCEVQLVNETYIVKPLDDDPYWFPKADSFHLDYGEQYYFYSYVTGGAECHLRCDDGQGAFSGQTFVHNKLPRMHHLELENHTVGQTYEVKIVISKYPIEEYVPFVRNTVPVFAKAQALEGYGWGINESVYNYIDWDKKQFVKRVGKVVYDGSSDEIIYVGVAGAEFTLFTLYPFSSYSYAPAITNYNIPYLVAWDANSAHFYASVDSVVLALPNSQANSAETLRAYLAENPLTVYYELASPIITDISNLITEDNYIGVEGGGTITMVNEHQYAVPSSIVYQTKEGA